MSHKDNQDLRNTGDGGWSYVEHELFSVFAPLIGPDGVVTYQAMCRLVPLAGVDPDRPVTVSSVSVASCLPKSTVARKMREIIALGMVGEKRFAARRPSAYQLPSLRVLASVGIDELKRRIGVPPGDTAPYQQQPRNKRQMALDRADTASESVETSPDDAAASAIAPEGADKSGVPLGDTDRSPVEMTLVELLVSQKTASVSQKTASVSQKTASVSQKRGSLFKEEKEEDKYSPLPLSQAKGGLLPNLSATADAKSKGENPFFDAEDAEDLRRAVAKVKRECGWTLRGIERAIEEQLRLAVASVDLEFVDWNSIAESMISGYGKFLAKQPLMAYKVGPMKFVCSGMWFDSKRWPWDEKKLEQRRRL